MTTRITQSMIARSMLGDLNDVATRLSATQQRMSSGRQISKPSDDPYGTSRALSLRGDLDGMDQYSRNIADGGSWLEITDSALGNLGDIGRRARELLVGAASDSAGPAARQAAAQELDQLTEAAKQEANATYAGRYVFAGTATTTPPYGAGDAYQGDTGAIAREIGPGVSVSINVTAGGLLGSGQAAGDGRLLDVLRTIAADLRSGNGDALRTTDLQRLDANLDGLTQARAQVGATTDRLQIASDRMGRMQESVTSLLSQTEDADMARTLIDFSTQQAVYQSALKAGANIVQASLLDFLR